MSENEIKRLELALLHLQGEAYSTMYELKAFSHTSTPMYLGLRGALIGALETLPEWCRYPPYCDNPRHKEGE
jgi:hypothetical protein